MTRIILDVQQAEPVIRVGAHPVRSIAPPLVFKVHVDGAMTAEGAERLAIAAFTEYLRQVATERLAPEWRDPE